MLHTLYDTHGLLYLRARNDTELLLSPILTDLSVCCLPISSAAIVTHSTQRKFNFERFDAIGLG